MAKIKNLSPKLSGLRSAEKELEIVSGTEQMGHSVGGLSAFSSVFKRGYGEDVFGVDERGVWLGGADFDTATIQMYYGGTIIIRNKETEKRRVRLGKLVNV